MAGGDREVDARQHLSSTAKTETHAFELDASLTFRQHHGFVGLGHIGWCVEQIVHTHERGARRGEVRIQPHEPLDRRHEAHLVCHEGDERPECGRSIDDTVTTVQEHGARARREQQPGQPTREVGKKSHGEQRADEGVVLASEARDFPLLRVGADYGAHALQGLDQERADGGAAFPQLSHAVLQLTAVAHEREERRRKRDQPDHEEPSVEVDEHAHGADQRSHLTEPGECGLRGHALDLADVSVDARDYVA